MACKALFCQLKDTSGIFRTCQGSPHTGQVGRGAVRNPFFGISGGKRCQAEALIDLSSSMIWSSMGTYL